MFRTMRQALKQSSPQRVLPRYRQWKKAKNYSFVARNKLNCHSAHPSRMGDKISTKTSGRTSRFGSSSDSLRMTHFLEDAVEQEGPQVSLILAFVGGGAGLGRARGFVFAAQLPEGVQEEHGREAEHDEDFEQAVHRSHGAADNNPRNSGERNQAKHDGDQEHHGNQESSLRNSAAAFRAPRDNEIQTRCHLLSRDSPRENRAERQKFFGHPRRMPEE